MTNSPRMVHISQLDPGMSAAVNEYSGSHWVNDLLRSSKGAAARLAELRGTGDGASVAGYFERLRSPKNASMDPETYLHRKVPDPTLEDLQGHVGVLDSAMQSSRLAAPVTVHRGVHGNAFQGVAGSREGEDGSLLKGWTFEDPSYMSTSVGTASAFPARPYQLVLHVPAGSHAVWLAPMSRASGQNELLLPRGTSYRIDEVTRTPAGTWQLNATVVQPGNPFQPWNPAARPRPPVPGNQLSSRLDTGLQAMRKAVDAAAPPPAARPPRPVHPAPEPPKPPSGRSRSGP